MIGDLTACRCFSGFCQRRGEYLLNCEIVELGKPRTCKTANAESCWQSLWVETGPNQNIACLFNINTQINHNGWF